MSETIDARDELTPFLRDFAYVLLDLGEIEPLGLSRAPEMRANLLALKVVHAEESPPDAVDPMTGRTFAGANSRGILFAISSSA